MASGKPFMSLIVPFSPQDGWALLSGGRVALVRANPYAIELLDRNGKVTATMKLQNPNIRVSSAELAAISPITLQDSVPKVKPPFVPGQIVVADGDDIWIQTTSPRDADFVSYDIVTVSTSLVRRLLLQPNTRVLRVTNQHIYTARVDEDGFHRLSMYER